MTAYAFASAEPRRADSTPLFLNLVTLSAVMDMLENTDDAGGRTDRIVEV
jgi:hypothetical protein